MKMKQRLLSVMLIISLLVFFGCNKGNVAKEEMLTAYKNSVGKGVDSFYEFLRKACLADFIESGYTEHSFQFKNLSEFNEISQDDKAMMEVVDNLKVVLYSSFNDKNFGRKMQLLLSKNNRDLPILNLGTDAKNFLLSTPFSKNQTFSITPHIPGLPFSLTGAHKNLKERGRNSQASQTKIKQRLNKFIDETFKDVKVKKDKNIYVFEFDDKQLKEIIKTVYNTNIAGTSLSKFFEPKVKKMLSEITEDTIFVVTTDIKDGYVVSIVADWYENPSVDKGSVPVFEAEYKNSKTESKITVSSVESSTELIIENKENHYSHAFSFSSTEFNVQGNSSIDFDKTKDNCNLYYKVQLKNEPQITIFAKGLFNKFENEARYAFLDTQLVSGVEGGSVLHSEFISIYSKNPPREIKFSDEKTNFLLMAVTNKDKMMLLMNELKYDLKEQLETLVNKDLSKYFD